MPQIDEMLRRMADWQRNGAPEVDAQRLAFANWNRQQLPPGSIIFRPQGHEQTGRPSALASILKVDAEEAA